MNVSKWAFIFIGVIIIALVVAVVALAIPPVGQGLHDFGVNVAGPGLYNGFTFILTEPLKWGSQSIAPAAVIWATITLTCVGFSWLIWTRGISKLRTPKAPESKPSYADQLSGATQYPTPELKIKVESATPAKVETPPVSTTEETKK